MTIIPTGAVLPATEPSLSPRYKAGVGDGFALPAPEDPIRPPAVQTRAPQPVGSAGAMLALQEQAGQAAEGAATLADREARRHGQELLEALASLQQSLVAEVDPAASLSRLAALADAAPQADDPALARILSAIRLRARLEIIRRAAASQENAASGGVRSGTGS